MAKVEIKYNPYTVKTDIVIDGIPVDEGSSKLSYVVDKRLQEWIEPRTGWDGIYKELRRGTGDDWLELGFIGTFGDYEDLKYAKDRYGSCFNNINLIHENRETAGNIDPYQKIAELKGLYEEMLEGPVEELKTADIQENFKTAMDSDFRIVIVAPISSGKSTLINAIMGRDLLPAVNQATTAVITEIKDNDSLDDFLVSAIDKNGRRIIENAYATKDLITELNNEKDPDDENGKGQFIQLIQLEGDIKNLPSTSLSTVFVDTPGGNNSQNLKHGQVMDEAINDENKSLILFVFTTPVEATDSAAILEKISTAIKNSANGKQSRDRFLFVANRMDEIDTDHESYEDVIQNTILPELKKKEITEPNLFLVSAETAKLIRMVYSGEKLTKKEKGYLRTYVDWFNQPETMLPKYAALDDATKQTILAEAEECMKNAENSNDEQEVAKNLLRAAEINSGITAVEAAIKQYLDKYAIAIKIKTVHDTFMKKVDERNMIYSCQRAWSQSAEDLDNVKKELHEKQEKLDHDVKFQDLRKRIEEIHLDEKPVIKLQEEIRRKADKLYKNVGTKIKKEVADSILNEFNSDMKDLEKEAQEKLNDALNNGVQKSCQDVVSEYEAYLRELDADGILNIAGYNMKRTVKWANKLSETSSRLDDSRYITTETVVTGQRRVEKDGLLSAVGRFFFGWLDVGYEYEDVKETREYVNLKELLKNPVQKAIDKFDDAVEKAIEDTENEVLSAKNDALLQLKGIDQFITDQMNEIMEMCESQEELEKTVEENKEKAQWIEDFINRVDSILTV